MSTISTQPIRASGSKLTRTAVLTLVFLVLFSFSEILILLKDNVYKPKADDIALYVLISLLAAVSARHLLTRLLLAVTFITQISEAIYYQFYGQFYGPSEVWRAFVETKDIASGITDSLGSLGSYFAVMGVEVVVAIVISRRKATGRGKWQTPQRLRSRLGR